nr:enolase-phosphatase E1 isoform X1 [Osmia lignaria]
MAGEKRTQDQEETLLSETVILVDIEGTTTSISFVKDKLFPYVRENLKKYIETKWEDEEFKQDFEKLKEQAKKDEEDKVDGLVPIAGANAEEQRESLIKNISWQMDCDRKTGALKQLQGHMWREAYKSGAIKAHVYEDVPKALESWTNDGRKVYVYSSGSVEAQKLLFGHTVHGDLLKYFSGYFDTEVGAKQESSSYQNILNKIGAKPSSVIFLTDVVKEAAAAKEAGLTTVIVLREGNAALTDEERVTFTTIKSFLDLTFQTSLKRQKLETTEIEENKNKSAPDVSEPMDTSEDVEMSDVSEKKVEKVEKEGAAQKETKESVKDHLPKETKISDGKTEEPKVTDAKDVSKSEKVMETVPLEKVEVQPSEVSTKLDASENVKSVISDKTESTLTSAKNDTDKPVVSDNVDKSMDVTEKVVDSKPAATVTTKDPVDAGKCEPKSKSEDVTITEKKTEETPTVTKETKSEDIKVSDVKTPKDTSQEKSTSKSIDEKSEECSKKPEESAKKSEECTKKSEECVKKPEECTKKPENETKEESTDKVVTNPSKTDTKKSESEESSTKAATTQESTKVEEKPSENGDVSLTKAEKEKSTPTVKESEATNSKADVNVEAKSAVKETKSETETESTTEKTSKVKETEEKTATSVTDVEKKEASDETKQESTEKPTKEEIVEETTKETTSTVDSEKKKLNGTTQNGDTDITVSDDKLHRNGLNEGSSKENVKSSTSESTSAQNGEPESSSEASADSIKVKKVVDSTIADGAGEPDVVPPVVVAATS